MSRPIVVTVAATSMQGNSPFATPQNPYTELQTTLMAACCLSKRTAVSSELAGILARIAFLMANQSFNRIPSKLSRIWGLAKCSDFPCTSISI
ncbi:hypothetical protein n025R [Gallid alphaherpesvirus 3]|uniref:Uncharacterized protein ORF223 n=1 Tax=Gallid alphaherpesvirus 3 TaxID=35250 RepID=F8TC25_9ALPH|nr:hypothetical protein n025R [Gallid alphaherpesvirus 3]AEI00236.1 hypothetical protein n025R [Gallid alphaherpesvirus 3]QEY02313.1 hypothetical protein [Gallid alphaherpesvirus 3]